MPTVSTCPKCGAGISAEGYCNNNKCIHSEKQCREAGDGGGSSPPFAD